MNTKACLRSALDSVKLSPNGTPGYVHANGLTEESAKLASELLTLNHTRFHTRWKATFHNHLVHHLLSLWSLGATPKEIQDMWDYNEPYQAPIEKPHTEVPTGNLDLKDPALFDKCLGKDECYADFLRFFEDEIAAKGVPGVMHEYLLKGDERADDIFCRMYTDLVHPMIHLGCGIEFQQPSLIAEAFAGACVHENWPKTFLLPTEAHAKSQPDAPSVSHLEMIDGMRQDPAIAEGVTDNDPFNKIPDGFLKRVTPEQLVPHLSQFRVKPEAQDLQDKLADMMHTCSYVMGAAQRPGKREAMDFVLLHNVTLSVHYPAILAQSWLSDHDKARLLEAKARVDAVMYAGCRSPALHPERIQQYVPRRPQDGWTELFHRAIVYRDEGHAAKLIRALYCLGGLRAPKGDFPITQADFLTIAHMTMDSIERAFEPDGNKTPANAEAVVQNVGQGGEMVVSNMMRWVFYGGLEKAWDHKPNLEVAA